MLTKAHLRLSWSSDYTHTHTHLYSLLSSMSACEQNWALLIKVIRPCKKLPCQSATDHVWVTIPHEHCVIHFKHCCIRKRCAFRCCTNWLTRYYRTERLGHRANRDFFACRRAERGACTTKDGLTVSQSKSGLSHDYKLIHTLGLFSQTMQTPHI